MSLTLKSKKWLANQTGDLCVTCKNRKDIPSGYESISYLYGCKNENISQGTITEQDSLMIRKCKAYEPE